ncbi:MAG: methyl-viologen-reducing hydrogenase subunit delta [Dehalococcoidia bacterium]|nr:methyl-viologen-reducing hydrogenase subunit delta [Dehalococcoidia bacterium]
MSTNGFEPQIVAFCCHYCASAAADLAGSMRLRYPPNILVIKLMCTGRIDLLHILRAFEGGVDGVMVAGCLEGNCHFISGNTQAKRRVQYAKQVLESIGVGGERLEMFNLSSSEGPRFAKIATEMTERIRNLGPSPVSRQKKEVVK